MACYWVKFNTSIYKAAHLKSKLHNTETLLAAAGPPCRLCYRPAVFFRQLRLKELLKASFKNFIISHF
jgi:hypothetical protein